MSKVEKTVEKTTRKVRDNSHISKADEPTRERLIELDDEMRSLKFSSDGKDYLPRMAIVEVKLSKKQQALVEKMMKKFSCTEKEATEFFTK